MSRPFLSKVFPFTVVAFLAGLLALGCTSAGATSGSAPTERYVSMAALEPKGGVTVDQEPFPSAKLPEGKGYELKQPDSSGRWEVSTYRWDPSTIVVNQGDKVTVEIIGINGKEHPLVIDGYQVTNTVRRGQVTRVTFTADKAGIFAINCTVHQPSMRASLIVLPSKVF